MKRSRSVKLTLMSAATATTLAACGEEAPKVPPSFVTIEQCVGGGFDRAACQTAYDEAAKSHESGAPKFANREQCLQGVDVDNCVPTQVRNPDGSIVTMFVPALAGFLVGQALANATQRQSYNYGGGYGGGYGGAPIYRSREYSGQYRDPGNLTTSRPSSGAVTTPSRPPNVNTTTISRGGFGSTSRSFGSGGGS